MKRERGQGNGLTPDQTEAVQLIKDIHIEHGVWKRANTNLNVALASAQPGEVIAVVGPVRVGKSRMLAEVIDKIKEGLANDEERPVVRIKLTSKGRYAKFSTKDLARSILEEVGNPIYSLSDDSDVDILTQLARLQRIPEDLLMNAVVKGLEARKTRYLCFDEAQEILEVAGKVRAPASVLNAYKGIAEELGIVLIFVGNYPLIQVLKLSPHILGRLHLVHFPRYQPNSDDASEFLDVVREYEKKLGPGSVLSNLSKWVSPLYKNSLGCVGVLNAIVRRILVKAYLEELEVTKDLVNQSCLPERELRPIEVEILEGEEAMSEGGAIPLSIVGKPRVETSAPRRSNHKPFVAKPKRRKKSGREI